MDQEYLAEIFNAKDVLCNYCDSHECNNCRVADLVNDAMNEMGEADEDEEDHYIRSSTNGDYGSGSPWCAPGMSARDFI